MYVTGGSAAPISGNEYATVTYNAATGAQLWAQRHTGYNGGAGAATSVAVSPSGGTVYITGYAQSRVSIDDYDTVAYNATTGTQLCAKFYSVAGESYASSVAVSPDREDRVRHRGQQFGLRHGRLRRRHRHPAVVTRYNGPRTGGQACSMAVNPTSGTVFVTGWNDGATSNLDYATIAYSG